MTRALPALALALVLAIDCTRPATANASRFLPSASAIRRAIPVTAWKAPNTPESQLFQYNFSNSPDGAEPTGDLIYVNGAIYGTTSTGGYDAGWGGNGTVFRLPINGKHESVLYSFKGGPDGAAPFGGLIYVNGTFYGSTNQGGGSPACSNGCGTVFALSPTGQETVLYRFRGGSDGALPLGNLLFANGALYGTTIGGGIYGPNCLAEGCGTIYRVSLNGSETVLHRFQGTTDGAGPAAGLINVNGTFYGTTYGTPTGLTSTIFTVTPSGVERVIYHFGDWAWQTIPKTGAIPTASLTYLNGLLYGTTTMGGLYDNGCVYSVAPNGVEHVVYSFTGKSDGANPQSDLIVLNGMLYGTAQMGGIKAAGTEFGVVFEVSPSGGERVVHAFDGPNGAQPIGGVLLVDGHLFGTTYQGGPPACGGPGCGTLFAVAP